MMNATRAKGQETYHSLVEVMQKNTKRPQNWLGANLEKKTLAWWVPGKRVFALCLMYVWAIPVGSMQA